MHIITQAEYDLRRHQVMAMSGLTLAEKEDRLGRLESDFTVVDNLIAEKSEPQPIPRIAQLKQRLVLGLITESEFQELKKLRAPEEKEASQKNELDKLEHRRTLGLLTEAEFFQQRDRLVEKFERGENPEPPTRRLLTEQQQQQECPADCECDHCEHLRNYEDMLNNRLAAGTITEQQKNFCLEWRRQQR